MQTLNIQIGGRSFQIGCEPEEQDNLQAAAELLNSEIASLQNDSDSLRVSLESSAILAALSFAAELLGQQSDIPDERAEQNEPRITRLIDKIDSILVE